VKEVEEGEEVKEKKWRPPAWVMGSVRKAIRGVDLLVELLADLSGS
jgi:hypothetical protein